MLTAYAFDTGINFGVVNITNNVKGPESQRCELLEGLHRSRRRPGKCLAEVELPAVVGKCDHGIARPADWPDQLCQERLLAVFSDLQLRRGIITDVSRCC